MNRKKIVKDLIKWRGEFIDNYEPKIPCNQQIKENGTPNLSDFLKKDLAGECDEYYKSAFGL